MVNVDVTVTGQLPAQAVVDGIVRDESFAAARSAIEIVAESWSRAGSNRNVKTSVAGKGGPIQARAWPGDPVLTWRETGTGMFGPFRKPITAHRRGRKFLKFQVGGKTVYARQTKGMRPDPILDSVWTNVQPVTHAVFEKAGRRMASRIAAKIG